MKGVLVGNIDVIEPEFNEFELEQGTTTTSSDTTKASTNTGNKSTNKNNINLCYNENDQQEHDSLQVDVPQDETGLYDDVMACPNISASEFNSDLAGPGSNESMSDNKSESQSSSHVNNNSKNESNSSTTGKSHGKYQLKSFKFSALY